MPPTKALAKPTRGPSKAAHVRDLARAHTARAVSTLAEIASDPTKPAAARVGAAEALLNRGWGKPVQPSMVGVEGLSKVGDAELAQMALQILGQPPLGVGQPALPPGPPGGVTLLEGTPGVGNGIGVTEVSLYRGPTVPIDQNEISILNVIDGGPLPQIQEPGVTEEYLDSLPEKEQVEYAAKLWREQKERRAWEKEVSAGIAKSVQESMTGSGTEFSVEESEG